MKKLSVFVLLFVLVGVFVVGGVEGRIGASCDSDSDCLDLYGCESCSSGECVLNSGSSCGPLGDGVCQESYGEGQCVGSMQIGEKTVDWEYGTCLKEGALSWTGSQYRDWHCRYEGGSSRRNRGICLGNYDFIYGDGGEVDFWGGITSNGALEIYSVLYQTKCLKTLDSKDDFDKVADTNLAPCPQFTGQTGANSIVNYKILRKDPILDSYFYSEKEVEWYNVREKKCCFLPPGVNEGVWNFWLQDFGTTCSQEYPGPTSCQRACEVNIPDRVNNSTRGEKMIVQSECTSDLDVDGNSKHLLEFVGKIYDSNLPTMATLFFWNPSEVESDRSLNGENYCIEDYKKRTGETPGLGFGTNQDCICWYDVPECVDKDGDGYGAEGTNTLRCFNKEEDCMDEGPTREQWVGETVPFAGIATPLSVDLFYDYLNRLVETGDSLGLSLPPGVDPFEGKYGPHLKFISQDYWNFLDKNSDGEIAGEINPSAREANNGRVVENGNEGFPDFKSATYASPSNCDDGLDNDCDGYSDCGDTSCYADEYCEGSCLRQCLAQFPKTKGSRCVNNLDLQNEDPTKGDVPQPSEENGECGVGEFCFCDFGEGCDLACENKELLLESSGKEYYIYGDYRRADNSEISSGLCFLDYSRESPQKKDYYSVYCDEEGGCCCSICEEIFRPDLTPNEKMLQDLAKLFNVEEEVKNKVTELFLNHQLFEEGQDLPYKKEVSAEVDKYVREFMCDPVVDRLSEVFKSTEGYYALAAEKILTDKGILVSEPYFLGVNPTKDGKAPPSPNVTRLAVEYLRQYRGDYSELQDRSSKLRETVVRFASSSPDPRCKICFDPDKIEPIKSGSYNSNSYFVFSDMKEEDINGNFVGRGYSFEPHGFVFEKQYNLTYDSFEFISKYTGEEFESACEIEFGDSELFELPIAGITFRIDNFTLNYPSGAVSSPLQMNITSVSFNCTFNEEIYPEPNLMGALLSSKEFVEGEKEESFARKVLIFWRGYF